MKCFNWLLCLLLGTAFAQYNAEQLNKLKNSKTGVIRLNDKTFDQVVGGPRDYTIMVLLTAEAPQFGCAFCRILGPQLEKVAMSWNREHPSGDGLFFAVADINENREVYTKLELTQAPNLWIYQPTEKPAPIRRDIGYDVYQFPQSEEQFGPLIDYMSRTMGFEVTPYEPFAWDRFGLTVATIILTLGVIKVAWSKILAILQMKQVWTAVTLVAVLMFTAGHMFNMIRKTPYVVSNGHGGVSYFVGGHQNQIGAETQIIALVYAILAFCTISLVVKVPKINNPHSQSLAIYGLVIVTFVVFSFLMTKFKVKNGGYPYSLLFDINFL